VVAIENVAAAINQIAQTTLRKVVGQHTLDQTLAETDRINLDIREILDGTTEEWGVLVTLVELKDIQLPETMKRAMARQAEAEREKRAKIIAAEGESLAADQLGAASDIMMAHPLALQLRNLQSLVDIGVDHNTTVVFPAPLMSTIQELGAFLAREQAAGTTLTPTPTAPAKAPTSTLPAVELPATGRVQHRLQRSARHSSVTPTATRDNGVRGCRTGTMCRLPWSHHAGCDRHLHQLQRRWIQDHQRGRQPIQGPHSCLGPRTLAPGPAARPNQHARRPRE
jgi:hypothetical protein